VPLLPWCDYKHFAGQVSRKELVNALALIFDQIEPPLKKVRSSAARLEDAIKDRVVARVKRPKINLRGTQYCFYSVTTF
jgi:hypothetical protein